MAMPLHTSDPILGPPRGMWQTPYGFAGRYHFGSRMSRVREYLLEVYRLAPLVGIDPAIVVAQSAVESGNWGAIPGAGATAWLERRNPASIGVTSTGKPGEPDIDAGHSWKDGTDAARAQIVHLLVYTNFNPNRVSTPEIEAAYDALDQYGDLDPRYSNVEQGGYEASVRLLSDLGNGRWAADANYAEKIAARGNQIFGFQEEQSMPETKLNMTRGLIPLPGFDDEAGTFVKDENVGMNRLGPRTIDVLFFHRALGYGARGVADWLKRRDVQGLTDWVIDPVTAYMIRLVKITGTNADMTGWAQGPYRKPTPDLQALTAKYGGNVNTINRHGESIEVAGMYNDPISAACKRDLAQWTASRAHDRGIRWDLFPMTPDGYSFIYGHKEACGEDYKICPGPVVWTFINDGELISMVRNILKAAQTGGTVDAPVANDPISTPAPAKYAKPKPIAALAKLSLDDLAGIAAVTVAEGTTFRVVTDQVVAVNDTPRFQIANVASTARVGPDIKKGEDFAPVWRFTAADGEDWYLTPWWTRVRVQDTKIVGSSPLTA